jgi:hypothetical protein
MWRQQPVIHGREMRILPNLISFTTSSVLRTRFLDILYIQAITPSTISHTTHEIRGDPGSPPFPGSLIRHPRLILHSKLITTRTPLSLLLIKGLVNVISCHIKPPQWEVTITCGRRNGSLFLACFLKKATSMSIHLVNLQLGFGRLLSSTS